MKKAVHIIPGGGIHVVDIPDHPDLNFWYKGLDCDIIEIVHGQRLEMPYVMVIDEEGLLKDDPKLNVTCSWLYGTDVHAQPIVGKAYIVREEYGPEGPELAGMSEEEAVELQESFRNSYLEHAYAVLSTLQEAGIVKGD